MLTPEFSIGLLVCLSMSMFAIAAPKAPFEIEFAGKPGKGDTSFSDAVWRIEARVYNRTKDTRLILRNEHKIEDLAFNLASTVSLFDSKGKPVIGHDHRPEQDRANPQMTAADLQKVGPEQNAFLTSIVIRHPQGQKNFTIVVGEQSWENLKVGSYRIRLEWELEHYGFDVLTSEAKRLQLPAPLKGKLISKDFKFEIKANNAGSYEVDCEG